MIKAIQIGYNSLFECKCKCAAEGGFKHIAVNYTEILGKNEDEWDAITDDIARILDENKLCAVQSHPHYYDLRLSSEIRSEELDFAMRQSIISSAKLGAKYCVFHPRSSINSGYLRSRSFEDNLAWFSELVECAAKHGTMIAVENIPVFGTQGRKMPLYSSNVEELCEIVDALGNDNAVICWDFGHANLMHYEQDVAISYLGKRIACTHIHNNFGTDDTHSTPDCGNIKWDKAMTALAATGYNGPLTLETHCLYPEEGMLRDFARFNFGCLEYLERLGWPTTV